MDAWSLALYVFASYLGLRALLSLMHGYEGSWKEKRLIQELEKLQARAQAEAAQRAEAAAAEGESASTAGARRAA